MSDSDGKKSTSLSVGDKIKLFFLAKKLMKQMKNVLDNLEGWKTVVASVLGIVGLFSPQVTEWIASNPQLAGSATIMLYLILRIITKRPIGGLSYQEPRPETFPEA